MSQNVTTASLFEPPLPQADDERLQWGQLYGCGGALAIANAALMVEGLLLVVAQDVQSATRLERELRFFLGDKGVGVINFPDWETLPYDLFSPLPELISQRLLTLNRLPQTRHGVLITPVSTLMQRLPPPSFLEAHSLILERGQQLDLEQTRSRLERGGYQCVSQVFSHGEFAVRGSLIDIYPMGSSQPYRVDLFDDEIDTIRTFDPESQRSAEKLERIEMLPAREFPLDEAGISLFRRNYRMAFEGDLQKSLIYQDVSDGKPPSGIEYYLPLFFEQTATLFDYLPHARLTIQFDDAREQADHFMNDVGQRFESRRHDIERPLLPPERIYLRPEELVAALKQGQSVQLSNHELPQRAKGYAEAINFATHLPPPVAFQARSSEPAAALKRFLSEPPRQVLFVAESAGRREMLQASLKDLEIRVKVFDSWHDFLAAETPIGLCVAPLEQGLWLPDRNLALITETQLYGERVRQERRRR